MSDGLNRFVGGALLFAVSLYWVFSALNTVLHASSFDNTVGFAVPLVPLGISMYLMRSASIRGPLRVVLRSAVCGLILVIGGVFVSVNYLPGLLAIILMMIGVPLIVAPSVAYLARRAKTR